MKLVVSKELKVWLDELDHLTQKERFFMLKFYSLISGAEFKNDKDEKRKEIRIKQTVFKELFVGENDELSGLLKKMHSLEIIYVGTSYKVKEFPKEYRTIFKSERFTTIYSEDYLTKRQNTAYEKKSVSDNYQIRLMDKLEFDKGKLKKVFKSEFNIEFEDIEKEISLIDVSQDKRLEKYVYSVYSYFERVFTLTVGEKSGRIYTNLTLMPRKIRSCLKAKNGKRLWEIDVTNSQPTFLISLITIQGRKIEEKIKKSVSEGDFYETIGKALGFDVPDVRHVKLIRDTVKKKFYFIIFGKVYIVENADVVETLKKTYPLFCKEVIDMNKENDLALHLQKLEADVVIPFAEKKKALTVHDAIMVITNSEKTIKEIAGQFGTLLKEMTGTKFKLKTEEI